jgi:recombinational DNA repair protein (RecF pathway)
MHHIYTTPAFIVHSAPHGEAGKFLLLFTKDFGMIGAVAQGIRLSQSKLRYHIQDYSLCMVSVVRGKEVWRLTGAHEIEHNKKTGILHIKIFKLLRRLLQGEEKNEKLFEIVRELHMSETLDTDHEIQECVTILKILNSLGYVPDGDLQLIDNAEENKSKIIKVINSALKESQL